MKYLITFEKGESVRWLGHLDILRTFERANPRERIAFASAIAVGVTGAEEPATVELTEQVEPTRIVESLNEKLPPGIRMLEAREIPDAGSRDLLNSFDRAELEVICSCAPDTTLETAQSETARLLVRAELPVEREREGRKKIIDLRPLIHGIDAESIAEGRLMLRMVLTLGAEGSAKPAEIVALMAEALPGLTVRRVHRVRLIMNELTAGQEHPTGRRPCG